MNEDDNLSNAAQAAEGAQAADENQSDETTEDEQESEGSETETDEGDESSDDEKDEAGGDDGDDDEDKGDDKPKKPSRSDRYKRRIERLEAELRTRDQASPRGSLSDSDLAARVDAIIGPKPDQKDFGDDYIGFERAMNAYEVDRRQTTREVKKQGETQAATMAERRRELAEDHVERVESFRKTAKDFDTVMKSATELKASPVVEDLVLESDKSAHLVYYLAKNPGALDKLNSMTEREAAREIGRIESRLSLPQPKTQTAARKPIAPLKGGSAPSTPDAALDAWISKKYGKQ